MALKFFISFLSMKSFKNESMDPQVDRNNKKFKFFLVGIYSYHLHFKLQRNKLFTSSFFKSCPRSVITFIIFNFFSFIYLAKSSSIFVSNFWIRRYVSIKIVNEVLEIVTNVCRKMKFVLDICQTKTCR